MLNIASAHPTLHPHIHPHLTHSDAVDAILGVIFLSLVAGGFVLLSRFRARHRRSCD